MNNYILAIDSSSTKSGIALFKNKELIMHRLVIHKGNEKTTWAHWNIPLFEEARKLTTKIENDSQVLIVIETPASNYSNKNLNVYGTLRECAGVWIGTIISLLKQKGMDVDNVTAISIQANNWRNQYGLNRLTREEAKQAAINLVKQFYSIDLNRVIGHKWDAKKKVWKETRLFGDDVAEAILIGRTFIYDL